MVEEAASLFVVIVILPVRVDDRSQQIVRRQRRVELGQAYRPGRARAEGDVGRGAAAGGGDGQNVGRGDTGAVKQVGTVPPAIGRGGGRRFGRVADRSLQHLLGDRLGGIDQLLQRGDAGIGGLQHLHAIADAVEQVVDVAGAIVEDRAVK